jgi:hypothetical protein
VLYVPESLSKQLGISHGIPILLGTNTGVKDSVQQFKI